MFRCLWALLLLLPLSAQPPADLYRAQCAGCHGPAGEGSRGPSLRTLQRANDLDRLIALLRHGVPGTEMPAFAPQTIADGPLRELAGFVLSLRSAHANVASTPAG